MNATTLSTVWSYQDGTDAHGSRSPFFGFSVYFFDAIEGGIWVFGSGNDKEGSGSDKGDDFGC